MKPYAAQQKALPSFPRTLHLPYQPNATNDDYVASEEEASVIFSMPVNVEEKIDGASVGMALFQDHPLLRNRDHILNKGYFKNTPAKEQFRPMWNWFYDNVHKFENLNIHGPYSVYGEWCLGQHGLEYNQLPDWFIAYDLYHQEEEKFMNPLLAREILQECGFTVPKSLLQTDLSGCISKNYPLMGYEALAQYTHYPSQWTKDNAQSEGIYVKTFDSDYVVNRFKMVRPSFVRGALWSPDKLSRNSLREK